MVVAAAAVAAVGPPLRWTLLQLPLDLAVEYSSPRWVVQSKDSGCSPMSKRHFVELTWRLTESTVVATDFVEVVAAVQVVDAAAARPSHPIVLLLLPC